MQLWNLFYETAQQTCDAIVANTYGDDSHIEVSADQYEQVIAQLPSDFTVPIHRGLFSYAQLQAIASLQKIDRIVVTDEGRIILECEIKSMSTAVSYAQSVWNGATNEEALQIAIAVGMGMYGEEFVESLLDGMEEQVVMNYAMKAGLKDELQFNSMKLTIKELSTVLTEKAMTTSVLMEKALSVLHKDALSAAIVTGVLSVIDIKHAIQRKISAQQLTKNMLKKLVSVIGGMIGFVLCSKLPTWLIPNVPIIISIVAGLTGMYMGGKYTKKFANKWLNKYIADDAELMLPMFEDAVVEVATTYVLNEEELDALIALVQKQKEWPRVLQTMYAEAQPPLYAYNWLKPLAFYIAMKREAIELPTGEQVLARLQQQNQQHVVWG
ncbi:hypothetical protein [Caryophanon tenue]|uniref:Uncharacterized protein n=1 Tax=Caryophanon tenue TaxID=33978 RepID=A0A1C0YER9_9BACL|nr:hypothetical protein [Caryophanon tenue]OCS85645.1 hypothetical protein A6M13_03005 [Caryophanon tenue]